MYNFLPDTVQLECTFLVAVTVVCIVVSRLVDRSRIFTAPVRRGDTHIGSIDLHAPSANNANLRLKLKPGTVVPTHDSVYYSKETLLDAARHRKLDACNYILEGLHQNHSLRASTLASFFRVLMSRKMTAQVVETYTKYPTEDLAIMRIVLACSAEEGRLELAKSLFERIGGSANLRDWHARLRATKYTKQRYDDAMEVLRAMKVASVEPDDTIHVCVFHICIQERKFEQAELYLERLPEANHYNSLLRAYSEAGRLSDVRRIFSKIAEPTAVSYGTVLHACVLANELRAAMDFIAKMHEDGVEVNTIHQTTLIRGLCRERFTDDALLMFSRIEYPDLVTFSTVIKALADCQRIGEAMALLDQLENQTHLQPDEIVYNSVLLGCVYTESVDLANQIFERMRYNGVRPGVATISTLLKMHSKMKMWDEALDLLRNLEKYEVEPEPRLFRQVLLGMFRRRQGKRIREVYQLFQKSMRESSFGMIPKEANGEILSACVHFNLASTAQELLDLMVDSEELVSIVDLNFVRDSLKRRQQNGAIDGACPKISLLRRISVSSDTGLPA